MSSASVYAVHATSVGVEVEVRLGLPSFSVIGLTDSQAQETRERVRAAITAEGFAMPPRRVIATVAPVGFRRVGPPLDLPVALCLLAASGQLDRDALRATGAVGELSLDGSLRPVAGVFSIAEHAAERGWRRIIVTDENADEARVASGVEVLGARGLRHAVDLLEGRAHDTARCLDPDALRFDGGPDLPDLCEVFGQGPARRALEIAAAGGHSLLLVGPSGGGKTMLARRLVGILPALSPAEAREVTRIHSAAGMLSAERPVVTRPPFRAPHHTISAVGLCGGGRFLRPGEVSLAHRGVLFLDEIAAFSLQALAAMGSIDDGYIQIARGDEAARIPAAARVVGAAAECGCGLSESGEAACVCLRPRRAAYRERLRRIAEKFDLVVRVPRARREEPAGEESAAVRARVEKARARRIARGQSSDNAHLKVAVRRTCALDASGRALLERESCRRGLSADGVARCLRVARTIADLAGERCVSAEHLAEAFRLRTAGDGMGA